MNYLTIFRKQGEHPQTTTCNYKIILVILCSIFFLFSCHKQESVTPQFSTQQSTPTMVFVTGFKNDGSDNLAKNWIDHAQAPFSDGMISLPSSNGNAAFGTGIFYDGTHIFTSGFESIPGVTSPIVSGNSSGSIAVYWKDEVKQTLEVSSKKQSIATSIALNGSDIYVAGSDTGHAFYWKNGLKTTLPDLGKNSKATAISIDNGNIYIAGFLRDTIAVALQTGFSILTKDSAVFWKNGNLIRLPQNGMQAHANAITVKEGDVYIGGNDDDEAALWNNNVETILPKANSNMAANALGVAVYENDVYLTGVESTVGLVTPFYAAGANNIANTQAIYWKNGTKYTLASAPSVATGIEVDTTGQFYISGRDNNKAVYWDNGSSTKIELTTGIHIAGANAITVSH